MLTEPKLYDTIVRIFAPASTDVGLFHPPKRGAFNDPAPGQELNFAKDGAIFRVWLASSVLVMFNV
jgi:hypothetical protein